MKPTWKKQQGQAIESINKKGLLLVFPIKNTKEPLSLWQEFYPRTPLRWEWNEDGDDRVMQMWMLMKKVSQNTEVVYSKWYQGRATFFSHQVFQSLLKLIKSRLPKGVKLEETLSRDARSILEVLESDSPLSTKQIKKMTELQGKDNEARYNRAMKDLFYKQLIVGFGEVEDGAFPSLAVGATRLLYENLWRGCDAMSVKEAQAVCDQFLPPASKNRVFFDKILSQL